MGLIEVLHAEIADTEAAIAQLQQESLGHADLLASHSDQVTPQVANDDSHSMLQHPAGHVQPCLAQDLPDGFIAHCTIVPYSACLRPVIRMYTAGTASKMRHLSFYCACAGLNNALRAFLCSPHVHV